jgi:hypothetical protein
MRCSAAARREADLALEYEVSSYGSVTYLRANPPYEG